MASDRTISVAPRPVGTWSGGVSAFAAALDLTRARVCVVVYLLISAPTLLGLTFLTGPFQTSDEVEHFFRAVQLSEGRVRPVISPAHDAAGDGMDATLVKLGGYYEHLAYTRWDKPFGAGREDARGAWNTRLSGREVFADFSNTVIYFPLAHAVPAAAILVMRAVHAPPLAWMYAGRLANAAAATVLFCLALLIFPDGRVLVFIIGLLPRTLFGEAALTADALLVPFAAIFTALLVRLADRKRLDGWGYAALAFAGFYVGVNKLAYIPIVILPPAVALVVSRRAAPSVLITAATGALTVAVWFAWMRSISGAVFPIRHHLGIDIYGQSRTLLREPARGALVLLHTLRRHGRWLLETLVGGELGSRQTRTPRPLSWLLCLLLLVAAVLGPTRRSWRPLPALLALGVAAGCVLAVFLLIYMQFNPLGAPIIEGVQGRYFLPLIPIAAAFGPRTRLKGAAVPLFTVTAVLLLGAACAASLAQMQARYGDPAPAAGERFSTSTHVNLE